MRIGNIGRTNIYVTTPPIKWRTTDQKETALSLYIYIIIYLYKIVFLLIL